MAERNFMEMLRARWAQGKFLCVGLDTQYDKIKTMMRSRGVIDPEDQIFEFNAEIIGATAQFACAFKPNRAFYAAMGEVGLRALVKTIDHIHDSFSEIPVIEDGKKADTGNTNAGYVTETFVIHEADAVTLHPYLGGEALEPFSKLKDKGIIVLCRTSNKGAGEFQDRMVLVNGDELRRLLPLSQNLYEAAEEFGWRDLSSREFLVPMYQYVGMRVARFWNYNANCAIVVGATYPKELALVRKLVGNLPILIPGIGVQRPDDPLEVQIQETVEAGQDEKGEGMIINASRSIIFASSNPQKFAQAARAEAEAMDLLINLFRRKSAATN